MTATPYVTKETMIERFGERDLVLLTDRLARPPAVIVDAVLDRAIIDATGLADGYVRKVYDLPLREVPSALARNVADIAFFYLNGRSAEKDSPVERAYRDAVMWLRDVSAGKVTLDVGAEPAAPAGGGSIRTSPPDRQFTRDSLRGL